MESTNTAEIEKKLDSGEVVVAEKGKKKAKKPKKPKLAFFEINIVINRWGDIHFKKKEREELEKISGIRTATDSFSGTKLKMNFKKDGIRIVKA